MNIAWSTISQTQQEAFLRQTQLSSLPEPSAIAPEQWDILVEIVGESATQTLRDAAFAASIGMPQLDMPADIGDWSSIMAMVAEIRLKLGQLQELTATEDTKVQKDRIAEAHAKEIAQIQESLKNLEKSVKTGGFAKIFGWIGAVVGVAAAIVATVATAGAAAPALAIALVGLTLMILQESGVMEKIVEYLAENPAVLFAVLAVSTGGIIGPIVGGALWGTIGSGALDEDQAKIAVQVTISVAMLALSIVSVVATGGASSGDAFAKWSGFIGQVVGGVSSLGSSGLGIAQSVFSYQAADIQADVQENKAWLAKLQQMMSEEMERLEKILEQLNQGVSDASDMLTDIANSNRSVISNMGM